MTVTILPGQDTPADPGQTPPPSGFGGRRVALLAAAAVVAAGALGGAWTLTRSDAKPAAATPAPTDTAAGRTVLVPRHGRVPDAQQLSVASAAFGAMDTALGGWAETGRVHRAHDSRSGADNKVSRCAGLSQQPAGPSGLESANYVSGAHKASGEVQMMASAAVAQRELVELTSPRTAACAKRLFLPQFRHGRLGEYVTATGLSLHRLPAVPRAFRMKIIVGYVINGQQIPVQVDLLGAVVGRAEVTLTVLNREAALAPNREVAALRAMTQEVKRRLR